MHPEGMKKVITFYISIVAEPSSSHITAFGKGNFRSN
jgi:hypothetical protein